MKKLLALLLIVVLLANLEFASVAAEVIPEEKVLEIGTDEKEEFEVFTLAAKEMLKKYANEKSFTEVELAGNSATYLEDGVEKAILDGEDISTIVEEETMYVPVETLSEIIEAEYNYNSELDIAEVEFEGETYTFENELEVATIQEDVVMVNAYEAAETLGYSVEVNENNDLSLIREFQNKRLIVKANYDVTDENAVMIVSGFEGLTILQYETEHDTQTAYEYFTQQNGIEYVQIDRTVSVADDGNSQKYRSWGAEAMKVDATISYIEETYGKDASEVVVAVCDTGVSTATSMFGNHKFYASANYIDDCEYDEEGHGTAVTSIICEMTGENVSILPIKVMGKEGDGTSISVYLGIMYAVEQEADIINLSLAGWGRDDLIESAIKYAYENDVLSVVAAGNNATDVRKVYPANVECALTVSAIKSDFIFDDSYSNYGTYIDLAAPGTGIDVLNTEGTVVTEEGTSMAAPHVTAAAALVKTIYPEGSAENITDILKEDAVDLGELGRDNYYGEGMVCLEGVTEHASYEKVSAPIFSVENNTVFEESLKIKISCAENNATIYYTVDGSEPSAENGICYQNEEIQITESTALKAVAYVSGKLHSAVTKVNCYKNHLPYPEVEEISPMPIGDTGILESSLYNTVHIDIKFNMPVILNNSEDVYINVLENENGIVGENVSLASCVMYDDTTLRIKIEGGDIDSVIELVVGKDCVYSEETGVGLEEAYTVVYKDYIEDLKQTTPEISFAGLIHEYITNVNGGYCICYSESEENMDTIHVGVMDSTGKVIADSVLGTMNHSMFSNDNAAKFYGLSDEKAILYYENYDTSKRVLYLINTLTGNILDALEIEVTSTDEITDLFKINDTTLGFYEADCHYVEEEYYCILKKISISNDKLTYSEKNDKVINMEEWFYFQHGGSVVFGEYNVGWKGETIYTYNAESFSIMDTIKIGDFTRFYTLGIVSTGDKLVVLGYPYTDDFAEDENRGLYQVILDENFSVLGKRKIADYYHKKGLAGDSLKISEADEICLLENGKIGCNISWTYQEYVEGGWSHGTGVNCILILDACGNIIQKKVSTKGVCEGLDYNGGVLQGWYYTEGGYRRYKIYDETNSVHNTAKYQVTANEAGGVYPTGEVDVVVGKSFYLYCADDLDIKITTKLPYTVVDGMYIFDDVHKDSSINIFSENNTSVTLNKSHCTLKQGESCKLIATLTPESAQKKGVSWISSDKNIAIVDSNGKVIAKSGVEGTAIITATAKNGSGAKAKCTITVVKKTQTITAGNFKKKVGDAAFSIGAKTDGDGALSYTVDNDKVVKVGTNGTVTIVGAGTAKITIRAAKTKNYAAATKNITITVAKGNAKFKVSKTSYTKALGSKAFSLGATAKTSLSYKSSNKKVATVDSKGKVTLKGCGKAVITITAGNKNYQAATKRVTIKVVPKTAKIKSVKSKKAGQLIVTWNRQKEADGYVIQYSTDKKFKKNVKSVTIKKNKTTSTTLKKLSKGKKYYVRVKAYKTIDKKKAYGTTSKDVNKTVKKK